MPKISDDLGTFFPESATIPNPLKDQKDSTMYKYSSGCSSETPPRSGGAQTGGPKSAPKNKKIYKAYCQPEILDAWRSFTQNKPRLGEASSC
jgi:hypothetical protein